jgi:hypothetical protein
MKNENTKGRELTLEEVKQIARIDALQLSMQNRQRPGYSIFAYLNTGNNCGEKRVYQALNTRITAENAGRYVLVVE